MDCFSPDFELTSLHLSFRHRTPSNHWYLKLRPLLRILAKYKEEYEQESDPHLSFDF